MRYLPETTCCVVRLLLSVVRDNLLTRPCGCGCSLPSPMPLQPFFWSHARSLRFLLDCSDRVETEVRLTRHPPVALYSRSRAGPKSEEGVRQLVWHLLGFGMC